MHIPLVHRRLTFVRRWFDGAAAADGAEPIFVRTQHASSTCLASMNDARVCSTSSTTIKVMRFIHGNDAEEELAV